MEQLYAKRDIEGQGEYYMRHLDAMTREGLHSKGDIAAELAHRDMRIAELEHSPINSPGTRQHVEGEFTVFTVQMARRSEQLEGIAEYIKGELKAAVEQADKYKGPLTVADGVIRRIVGYCEQIGIIADELKAAGK
jgi:hypothetical protein